MLMGRLTVMVDWTLAPVVATTFEASRSHPRHD